MLGLPPVPPVTGFATWVRLPPDYYVRMGANDYSVHPEAPDPGSSSQAPGPGPSEREDPRGAPFRGSLTRSRRPGSLRTRSPRGQPGSQPANHSKSSWRRGWPVLAPPGGSSSPPLTRAYPLGTYTVPATERWA
ncbi:Mu transposase domain-containing protein [Arthrobacter sp. 92]|uniref:Mu transposase domain-containing protein n=1 Tax=Arthrobacter sp. 92 TaxID=3418175 RepID=UPI003D00D5FC